jgi:hypothetical protein
MWDFERMLEEFNIYKPKPIKTSSANLAKRNNTANSEIRSQNPKG